MTAPTIADLTARVEAVRRASLIAKPAASEVALVDLLQYLAEQDSRIKKLERMVRHGDSSEKTSSKESSTEARADFQGR